MTSPTSGAAASQTPKMAEVLTDRRRVGLRPPSTTDVRKLSRLSVKPSVSSEITWLPPNRPACSHCAPPSGTPAASEPNIAANRGSTGHGAVDPAGPGRGRRADDPSELELEPVVGDLEARPDDRLALRRALEQNRVRVVDVDE